MVAYWLAHFTYSKTAWSPQRPWRRYLKPHLRLLALFGICICSTYVFTLALCPSQWIVNQRHIHSRGPSALRVRDPELRAFPFIELSFLSVSRDLRSGPSHIPNLLYLALSVLRSDAEQQTATACLIFGTWYAGGVPLHDDRDYTLRPSSIAHSLRQLQLETSKQKQKRGGWCHSLPGATVDFPQ